ncbi:bifunctional (p)ppGpp synthetase/guanosine-3',5'-bis(diphosphate) 3'-pyrophosphohydrolase [Propionimicrobium sp. PCR01-08-3]|uniref:RelA/SpoT family protein n=1 Tax=Propionimicrobium sp. PCR01-08-3 TaxID=3052086 RepID=UPI00255C87EF|nr:bifunctional (p)ppGpp synthetase/guanosine-3',5'-bis(diphosphate) 3'-pyrophosphohydrolase [Propionimicrobium sp. PCR01-08-3]WIY83880.1 bifunctional (p)ppGpp synthetase/guanosine-3',5'-bis(diphosphate) 3'-pyrophosphohydrolase [Propionimicrobium sp. PCR01-08-3]
MSEDSVYGPYGSGQGTPGSPRSSTLERVSSGPEQPRLRMRQRLAWFGAANRPPQSAVLDPLFSVVKANHPKADLEQLERAYHTAEHYHRGQSRKSGEPYITHPLAVATILAELGMTESTLCAALLHDTVEDTSYTLDQLRTDFGDEIAQLVDGVTKLDKLTYGESAKAETIRKLVVATARDVRVLVIKLADRLHNMRTISYLRPDKQQRIARDTLEIFAPLAHRLGMNAIKWELEDLSFATLQPKVYDEIVRMVAEAAPQRERQLREVIDQAQKDLSDAGIKATVYGRPKHYYSIYQKMVVRGRDFSDIYDLVGLRVLVDTTRDCYGALGVLHTRWNPLPGRFKDYIAMPKYNMYQSLHTTVLGPGNRAVEFQIRTHEMHRRAEYGVAAHWKYKEDAGKNSAKNGSEVDPDSSELSWVQQINEWQRETDDPGEFLESLRFELNTTEVYVFTPKGDVIALPKDATPVDLAYAIHSEVGDRCIGARVNGRLVPLSSKLANGDICEILVSRAEDAGPSRDWLSFVASPRATSKIKQHFTRERREEAIENGKDQLARQLRRSGLPIQRLLTVEHLAAAADSYRLPSVDALYAAIGEGNVGAQGVVQRIVESEGGLEAAVDEGSEDQQIVAPRRRSTAKNDAGVVVEGQPDMWVKLAKCCTPLPGDAIIGFVTRENGVSVHRRDCTNAANLLSHPERIVDVDWATSSGVGYLVAIQVEALDRTGLLSELTRALSDQSISITSAVVNTTKDRLAKVRLTFECSDPQYLDHIINQIRRVSGVYDVFRVSQAS